jgi:hypothetical protein
MPQLGSSPVTPFSRNILNPVLAIIVWTVAVIGRMSETDNRENDKQTSILTQISITNKNPHIHEYPRNDYNRPPHL